MNTGRREGREIAPQFEPNYEELWQFIQGDIDSGNYHLRDVSNELTPELKRMPGTSWPEKLKQLVASHEKIGDGRYCVLRNLNSGGTGTVQLALDLKRGLLVATKSINVGVSDYGAFMATVELERRREAYLREMENVKKLGDNPYLLKIFDIVAGKHAKSIVTEYLPKGDLSKSLNDTADVYGFSYSAPAIYRRGKKTVDRLTASVAVQACLGLDFMHEHGVIHLDVKPQNIFVVSENDKLGEEKMRVKLGDFDLGNVHLGLKDSKEWAGTVGYVSPEMLTQGKTSVGPGSDLYSLGVVLYRMSTGRQPHNGNEEDKVFRPPDEISNYHGSEKYAMDDLIMNLVNIDPIKRPNNAGEVAKEIKKMMMEQYPGIEKEFPFNLIG